MVPIRPRLKGSADLRACKGHGTQSAHCVRDVNHTVVGVRRASRRRIWLYVCCAVAKERSFSFSLSGQILSE